MKLTNTVYRYAIRKLKVGTASVAVAALMFLGMLLLMQLT